MSAIENAFRRLFPSKTNTFDEAGLSDLSEPERAIWDSLTPELKELCLLVGYEAFIRHEDWNIELFGPYSLCEFNATTGTFGQLRDVVEAYAYDKVRIIGSDLYYDAAGQIGQPGSIHRTISYDLDGATKLADSLEELLNASSQAQW